MTRWVCVSFRENSGLNADGVQRQNLISKLNKSMQSISSNISFPVIFFTTNVIYFSHYFSTLNNITNFNCNKKHMIRERIYHLKKYIFNCKKKLCVMLCRI